MTLKFHIRFTFDGTVYDAVEPSGRPPTDTQAQQHWLDEFVDACMNHLPPGIHYRFLRLYQREAIVQFVTAHPVADPVNLIQMVLYDDGGLNGEFKLMVMRTATVLVPAGDEHLLDCRLRAECLGGRAFVTTGPV